jgi:hypothetical protein
MPIVIKFAKLGSGKQKKATAQAMEPRRQPDRLESVELVRAGERDPAS